LFVVDLLLNVSANNRANQLTVIMKKLQNIAACLLHGPLYLVRVAVG